MGFLLPVSSLSTLLLHIFCLSSIFYWFFFSSAFCIALFGPLSFLIWWIFSFLTIFFVSFCCFKPSKEKIIDAIKRVTEVLHKETTFKKISRDIQVIEWKFLPLNQSCKKRWYGLVLLEANVGKLQIPSKNLLLEEKGFFSFTHRSIVALRN